jgi:signal transduction histidine kinase/pSer/pThr/pTyr-binding forkhead associated (FHA) protein
VASLFVIQGADQGKRFELSGRIVSLGREGSNTIRLHDSEISRRHAEVRVGDDRVTRLVDLGSANGTFLNGQPVDSTALASGDQLRLGRTVLLYSEGASHHTRDLTERVDLLSRASQEDRSAIVRSIPVADGSRVLQAPTGAGEWLRVRLANLAVMYQATQAISHIVDLDELLQRILQLVFESVGADRAAVLMADDEGRLTPTAVRWRGEAEPDERISISQSIIDHVREKGEAVISTDAPADKRFGPAQSIVDFGIREALCVPLQGRHMALGVIYADVRSSRNPLDEPAPGPDGPVAPGGRFTQEHLTLMAAVGHQAGLAIESTRFYEAKLHAERLAAVGQTIATLSHHIKNILQGLRGGSYLIDMGLNASDEAVIRRGWGILEKNQSKIYNLVMDMLSYSKDREPALEPTDLNGVVADVVELMQSRAQEMNVDLQWSPGDLPTVLVDPDGIHRAVLNVLTNAIDAAEREHEGEPKPGEGTEESRVKGRVQVATAWAEPSGSARIAITDNGPGIAPEAIAGLFQVFTSSKGTRGTGLGLPVSLKIVREHGGTIDVQSAPGAGATFTIDLPQRRPDASGGDASGLHPAIGQ